MFTLDRAFEVCPELRPLCEFDNKKAEQLKLIIDSGFGGAFERYLSGAEVGVLGRFLDECSRLEFGRIVRHREALKNHCERKLNLEDVEPMRRDGTQTDNSFADAELGWKALRDGRLAAVVFAGGAATRFQKEIGLLDEALPIKNEALARNGFAYGEPKGCFPISPVIGMSFIQMIIAEVLERSVRAGRLAPVLFMVSDVTEDRTAEHLSGEMYGFPRWALIPFIQNMFPRLDADGELIVQPDGSLLLTGSGHGGIYAALEAAEGGTLLERLKKWGVTDIVMGNVDNALLSPLHAGRVGFHVRNGAGMTISVTERAAANEKVGIAVRMRESGKWEVVEYSVMDEEMAAMRAEDGSLLFNAGNINTLAVAIDSIRSDIPEILYTDKMVKVNGRDIASSTSEMMSHALCTLLEPEKVKLYYVDRDELFLPTKNMIGVDSVEHTFNVLVSQALDRLIKLGAEVEGGSAEPKVWAELPPFLGLTLEQIASRGLASGWKLAAGSRLYLGARYSSSGGDRPYSEKLTLEEGAQLIIDAKMPYGRMKIDEVTRIVEADVATASKAGIGPDVTISRGVRLYVSIESGGVFEISAGKRITESMDIVVGPDEKVSL